jgi:hypothetical protein
MIDNRCFTPEWLLEKRKIYKKADPSIIEKVVYALHLLQKLKQTSLPFIFKGGTSLLLLLPVPARFSIDIDIIVPPDISRTHIEQLLSTLKDDVIFTNIIADERRSYKGPIIKAHYKFLYNSLYSGKPQEVLLDILFEKNHYPVHLQRPVTCEWISLTAEAPWVTTPDINGIAGDKLTAFAPNTTGIPYNTNKDKEIIKQLFDIGSLYEWITDLDILKRSFHTIAALELQYRNMALTPTDVLNDVLATALILARRENQINQTDNERFKALVSGIKQFGYFVYNGSFRIDEATVAAAKAAVLASAIKTNFTGPLPVYNGRAAGSHHAITHHEYAFLNKKLRNINGGALFYWAEAIKLLYPEPCNVPGHLVV